MKKELEQAEKDWSVLNPQHRAELKERWDGKATSWEQELRSNEEKRQHHENRILSTIDWLETFGLFRGDCDVADIGCGPGRFVAEFAKKSRYAVGLDISPKMIEYGANYAREQRMDNAEFFVEDFASMDIVARGWEKRFDLAFSSITPAIRGKEGLENLMAISRKWCFNSCFVNFSNELHKDIMNDLFHAHLNGKKNCIRNGSSSYLICFGSKGIIPMSIISKNIEMNVRRWTEPLWRAMLVSFWREMPRKKT